MVSQYHDIAGSFTTITVDETERFIFRSKCGLTVTGRTFLEARQVGGRHPGILFTDSDGRTFKHNFGDGGFYTDTKGRKTWW